MTTFKAQPNTIGEAYNIDELNHNNNNLIIDLYTAVHQRSVDLLKEVDVICGPDAGDMPEGIQFVIANLRLASDIAIEALIAELQCNADEIEVTAIDVNEIGTFTTNPQF